MWPWRRILNGTCISISNLPENVAWQSHRPEVWGPLKSGTWGGRPTCHPQMPPLPFNPLSNNLEILIIQYMSTVVPKLGVLLSTSKHLHQWSRQIWGRCPKMPLTMCINHCGTSWLLFSHLINFCNCDESIKHSIEPKWPWTSTWRR